MFELPLMRFGEALSRVASLSVPVLLGVSGAGLTWVATARYGAGVTPDSVAYVSVARRLLAGEGFTLWTGAPLVDWPPLYPMFLAAAAWVSGVDPLAAVRPTQAILTMLVIGLSWALLSRHLRAPAPLVVLATAAVVLAPSLVKVSRMAWSESLFLALVLGAVLALEGYVSAPRRSMLLTAAGLAALACVTRYAGVALALSGAAVLLLRHRREWTEALWATTVFGAIAAWPLSLWLVRNVSLTGLPLGARHASDTSLAEALLLTGGTFGEWLFGAAPGAGAILAGLSAAALLGALVLAGERPRRPGGAEVPSLLPLAIFLLVYVAFLVHSAVQTAFDPLGHRLLSPVHPPLLVIAFVVVASLAAPLSAHVPRVPLRAVASLLLGAWLTVPLVIVARDVAEWTRDGAGGFSRSAWRESDTLAVLRTDPWLRSRRVYSNAPDLCYVLAGIPASLAPTRASFHGGGGGLAASDGRWPDDDAWLVWFDGMKRGYVLTPPELAARVRLEPVRRLSDGALYAVRAGASRDGRAKELARATATVSDGAGSGNGR